MKARSALGRRVGLCLGRALAPGLGLVLAVAAPLRAQERVLFVGNSFTGNLGGVGELVELMADASGVELDAEQVAPGGFTFEAHFEQPGQGRDVLAAGGWDRVVLQEQSGRPIFQRSLFERYGRLLVAEAVSAGARPMFYLTWGRADHPEDQEPLTRAYCDLAAELGVDLAPVGEAWRRSLAERPDLRLHASDDVHANLRGFYLAALVLYGALTGESPVGLSHALGGVIWVTPAEAEHLQEVARETLEAQRRGEVCGTALPLLGGRFEVRVEFRDRFGGEGPGRPVALTDDTGAFWFFEPDNLELMVKVLDGRPVNGRFWVFFGALSNVAYTVRVTDTFTQTERTYDNPQGTLASRADTAAFPGDG
jgi:hypothetical protein